jgi:hypothetical protein
VVVLWNILLLLPVWKDANKVLGFLELVQKTIHVFYLTYVLRSQCKEKGHEIREHERVVLEYQAY